MLAEGGREGGRRAGAAPDSACCQMLSPRGVGGGGRILAAQPTPGKEAAMVHSRAILASLECAAMKADLGVNRQYLVGPIPRVTKVGDVVRGELGSAKNQEESSSTFSN